MSFDEYFAYLEKFKLQMRHLNVKSNSVTCSGPDGIQLGRWVNNIRAAYKNIQENGSRRTIKLYDHEIQKLRNIGFDFRYKADKIHNTNFSAEDKDAFQVRAEELVTFQTEKGHINIPEGELKDWVTKMRNLKASNKLDPYFSGIRLKFSFPIISQFYFPLTSCD